MKSLGLLVGTLVFLLALTACKDDDDASVPIEDIPGDKLVVDLTADEFTGLCDWAAELSDEKLTPETACDGVRVQFHGCMRVHDRCTATVDEWKRCLPDMIDKFAEDPCASLEVDTSEEFAAFIDAIPSCEGLGACANTME
jgi:hypothetical protein